MSRLWEAYYATVPLLEGAWTIGITVWVVLLEKRIFRMESQLDRKRNLTP